MTIGFIGTGNMGGALIAAMAPRYELCAYNRGAEKLQRVCEATGAEGISCVGNKFVIWRFSEKCQEERNQTGRAKRKDTKVNPVRKGAQARRAAAKAVREQRNEYFRQQAIEKSIEKSREKKLRESQK